MLFAAQGSPANELGRASEPVVLTGVDVPALSGADPTALVAFRYDSGWVQIPVQVDQRAVVDFGTIYGWGPSGYTVVTYTDTAMFTGADPDPLFDSDDELIFLAGEAGASAPGVPDPEHALPGTGVEVELTNPLTSSAAFVYLFESDGILDPGAGGPPIPYVFYLESGPYKTTYGTTTGPNPEDSSVTTSAYSVHFSDRWIRDETAVFQGGASGIDILDRHKNLFGPGNCARSEDTFSAGEGAFIINRAGPVRALRGYVGANSGPTTHRIHAFYEEREEVLTVLRVHAISGMMDYFDYSPAAASMTYANDLNPSGVTVDGSPDAMVHGELNWEMITGPQGTIGMAGRLTTDIPDFTYTSYYSDYLSPPYTQCTGDAYEYGASGLWVDHDIPNTDPGVPGTCYTFEVARTVAYGAPGVTTDFAVDLADEVDNPLLVSVEAYVPTGVADAGADTDQVLSFRFAPNPATGVARVHLSTTVSGLVTLELFDVSGRAVGYVLTEHVDAGPRVIEVDVSDLPVGVYFARAQGPEGSCRTSRMVVLR